MRVLGKILGKNLRGRMASKFMGKRRMRARGTAGPNGANTSSVGKPIWVVVIHLS